MAKGHISPSTRKKAHLGLDELDRKIIDELIADANKSSSVLASKYKRPLSTIQRRRARIEAQVLAKKYFIRPELQGYRHAVLMIFAKNGEADIVADTLSEKYPQITTIHVGLNSTINITASFYYKDSMELYGVMETIGQMPSVEKIEFFEVVRTAGNRQPSLSWLVVER